jgi:ABC-type glycerol-3-phosphate transport system substrate-binding protein
VAVEAMQWVADLALKHRVMAPPGDTSLGAGNLWNQGQVAIMIGGAGTVGSTITARPDFEWDLFLTPKHPKTGRRLVTANDNPMVVMASARDRDAAWRFDLWTAEKLAQDLVGKYRIDMPVLKASAADSHGWLAPPPATMRLMTEYMKQATFLSFHKNWLQWYNETQAQVLPAFKGEMSVKEALDRAAQVGDTRLHGV